MSTTLPAPLVDAQWLMQHWDAPDLRILDCTVLCEEHAGGTRFINGYKAWADAHIPGSAHIDLIQELSDTGADLPFTLPSPQQFAKVMSNYGVGEGTSVVLYDRDMNVWAARVWWMLRIHGFTRVAILNGGWQSWCLQNHPVSNQPSKSRTARFVPRFHPALLATTEQVRWSGSSEYTCLVNALGPEEHQAQHIPDSTNVPARALVDPDTHAFRPLSELREIFHQAGVQEDKRIIIYCGAGIVACVNAFALFLLDATWVAVYDGSLGAWLAAGDLPIVTGGGAP